MTWPLLAAMLVVSWSSGFVGVRYASQDASIVQVLFWRSVIAGTVLLPFAVGLGPKLSWAAVIQQMGHGFMIVFIYLGGFALAIDRGVPTGLVALISDLVPLAIAILAALILGERMSWLQWVGTAVAVCGVIIVSIDSLGLGRAPGWAYLLTVGIMLVFALSTVLQKRLGGLELKAYQSVAIQFLTGAALFGVIAAWRGELMPQPHMSFIIGISWLVLISTFFCYFLYYACLRIFPAGQVSAAIYLSPPVTMIWAWALFNEPLTWKMAIGLLVTLAGVWLTSVPARSAQTS